MNDLFAISPNVIEWMKQNVDRSLKVIELGGGRGTKRLQRYFKNSLTIESEPQWVGFLLKQSCAVLHKPLVDEWYEVDNELLEELRTADVVIIDGPIGYLRNNVARHMDEFKDGALLIIDDTQRVKTKQLTNGLEVVAIVTDRKRTTHICRKHADNSPEVKAQPVAKKKRRKRSTKVVSKHKVEEVQTLVLDTTPDLRDVQESGEHS
jgi:hypothetical protein